MPAKSSWLLFSSFTALSPSYLAIWQSGARSSSVPISSPLLTIRDSSFAVISDSHLHLLPFSFVPSSSFFFCFFVFIGFFLSRFFTCSFYLNSPVFFYAFIFVLFSVFFFFFFCLLSSCPLLFFVFFCFFNFFSLFVLVFFNRFHRFFLGGHLYTSFKNR